MFHIIKNEHQFAPFCPYCGEEKVYTLYGWQCTTPECVNKRRKTDEFKAVVMPRDGNVVNGKRIAEQHTIEDWSEDDE